MGKPNDSQEINGRNPIFLDIQGRSQDTSQSEPMQCTGRRIYSSPKRWVDGGAFRFVRRVLRSGDHSTNRVSTKTHPALQQVCKDEGIQCRRPGATKRDTEHIGYKCQEAGPHLGRVLQGYSYHGSRSLLLGGPR